MGKRSRTLLAAAAFAGLGARAALATPVGQLAPPVIDINGTALDLAALHCSAPGGPMACDGSNFQGNGYALESWSLRLNPDPTILASFSLTNLSAATQTFVVTVTLSVPPTGPSLSITGSIGAGTLTDLNANGATLTDDGSSLYTALIDGSPVRTLLDPPQSFSALPNPFGGLSMVTIGPASFGPEALAQSANVTIGMRTQFTLTGGDNVDLPIFIDVQAVPEPSTLLLLGLGLAGLAAGARHRRGLRAQGARPDGRRRPCDGVAMGAPSARTRERSFRAA